MGFWIFMLVMVLFIPLIMIGFGGYFMKKAPKKINTLFGYRTAMSMKNKVTWKFAHHYAGKVWFITGWIVLIITIAIMLMLVGQDTEKIGWAGAIVSLVQCIPLLAVIPATEKALKEKFDEHGNRR
jgi:uncharacterized membrane protein